MKKFIFIIIILIISKILFSQNPPDTLWTKTFGGIYQEAGYCIQQTTDGGYIVVGSQMNYNQPLSWQVYLIKTDNYGNEEWITTFGIDGTEEGYSVNQTNDNGYIITGRNNNAAVYVIKTDEYGNEVWSKSFEGKGYGVGYSIEQTYDGGYIITGETSEEFSESQDVYLIRTDCNGDTLWTQTFGYEGVDIGHSVKQTDDTGFIIGGYSDSINDGAFYVIKTNCNGVEEWAHRYGIKSHCYSIDTTSDGGYILTGFSKVFYSTNGSDIFIIKIDSYGDLEWIKYLGEANDGAKSIQQTTDGGFILTGYTNDFAGDTDIIIKKLDCDGNEEWSKTFSGNSNYDVGECVIQTTDFGFIIAGHKDYGGPNSNWDVWLIKLGTESVIEGSVIANEEFYLINYPNPFNPETKIVFNLPEEGNVKLDIYNIEGQKVKILLDCYMSPGRSEMIWNGKDSNGNQVGSGIYFYKLNVNGKTEAVKKCLLLK